MGELTRQLTKTLEQLRSAVFHFSGLSSDTGLHGCCDWWCVVVGFGFVMQYWVSPPSSIGSTGPVVHVLLGSGAHTLCGLPFCHVARGHGATVFFFLPMTLKVYRCSFPWHPSLHVLFPMTPKSTGALFHETQVYRCSFSWHPSLQVLFFMTPKSTGALFHDTQVYRCSFFTPKSAGALSHDTQVYRCSFPWHQSLQVLFPMTPKSTGAPSHDPQSLQVLFFPMTPKVYRCSFPWPPSLQVLFFPMTPKVYRCSS